MKSILVSNLNNLGDVVCSTAALDLIRRAYPGVRVGLIVRPDAEGGIKGNPVVDDLYVYRYRSGSGLGDFRRVLREVRERRYEVFLTLDRKSRSLLLARLAGIRERISPTFMHWTSKGRWYLPWLSTRMVDFRLSSPYECLKGMFEEPVRRAFGIRGEGRITTPPISDASRARARELLAPGTGRPKVGFSVRANFPQKNWLPERFAELMDRLEERLNAFVFVTGAPGDREYVDDLLRLRRGGGALNLAGRTDIPEMVALGAAADLFVTLDTGTLHLVANSGVRRLICLFGCTPPSVVQASLDAAGGRAFWSGEKCCFDPVCAYPLAESPCRLGVGVDEVYAAAEEMLGS